MPQFQVRKYCTSEDNILIFLLTQDILRFWPSIVLLITVSSFAFLLHFGLFRDLIVALFIIFDLKRPALANDSVQLATVSLHLL